MCQEVFQEVAIKEEGKKKIDELVLKKLCRKKGRRILSGASSRNDVSKKYFFSDVGRLKK